MNMNTTPTEGVGDPLLSAAGWKTENLTDIPTDEKTIGLTYARTDEGTDVRTKGRTDRLEDGPMNQPMERPTRRTDMYLRKEFRLKVLHLEVIFRAFFSTLPND